MLYKYFPSIFMHDVLTALIQSQLGDQMQIFGSRTMRKTIQFSAKKTWPNFLQDSHSGSIDRMPDTNFKLSNYMQSFKLNVL